MDQVSCHYCPVSHTPTLTRTSFRELHCVELGTDLQIRPVQWTLQAFRRLRKLRIDFDPSQSNAMLLMRFDHPRPIASHLQELEVHDVSWPSPMVVRLVSEAFPALRVLKLMQDLVWCGLCNTCRFATFKDHPPPEIMYEKTVGLPVSEPVCISSSDVCSSFLRGITRPTSCHSPNCIPSS